MSRLPHLFHFKISFLVRSNVEWDIMVVDKTFFINLQMMVLGEALGARKGNLEINLFSWGHFSVLSEGRVPRK